MKRFKLILCTALTILALMSATVPVLAYNGGSSTLYSMYVDGKDVGVIRYPARALYIYDSVEKGIRGSSREEVFISSDISFKEIKTRGAQPTKEKILAESIKDAIDIKTNAYAITIDGTKLFYVNSAHEAQKIIEDIKAPYIKSAKEREGCSLEDVSVKEEYSFVEELVSQDEIITPEEAEDIILNGREGYKEYEVKEGDNIWVIAEANDITLSDLEAANPGVSDRIIQPGEIFKIGHVERLLTVVTKERLEYTKEIDFETQVKEDRNLEVGKTKVLQEGEKGKKEIVALVTREDGQEVDREIVEEKVVKEPVKRIEAKGTKPKPQPKKQKKSSSGSSSTVGKPTSRGSATGNAIANYAKKFAYNKTYKYSHGSTGPTRFDCSGFTSYVYRQFGINFSNGSVAQRSVGKRVKKSDLKPGDLVCFKNSNHVGIYIGNGNMVHMSSPKAGIIISSINGGRYPKRYVTSRRVVN
ncbi:MAG: LysM peptidoglycan-binding domain-containing protein [Clostridiales bacterium]|nr:LysM peptidoglycan-binding domain-containing protein [Clostridiales bacterium]